MNIAIRSTPRLDSPAFHAVFITFRGVAVVTPSRVKEDILPAKEISRKHLAASAGFMKF